MKIGSFVIFGVCASALFAPWLAPFDPLAIHLEMKLQGPSIQHLLGTDQNGADLLSILLWGARHSMTVALSVAALCLSLGLVFGSLAGYFGGTVETFFLRTIDLLYAFPGFLLALSVVAFAGPGTGKLILALSITGWTGYARLVRAEVLNLKNRDFVVAAQALGASPLWVIHRHLWPNIYSILAVQLSLALGGTIVSEAGLSFLGLGASTTTASWGSTLGLGRQYLFQAPHICIFAGLAIGLSTFGFNLIGDGLRLKFNPKSQLDAIKQ